MADADPRGRLFFSRDGGATRREIDLPPVGQDFVEMPGACPSCGAENLGRSRPFRVRGENGGRFERGAGADARALCCDTVIGSLLMPAPTIFGVDEDERMLVRGRPRVYADGGRYENAAPTAEVARG